MHWKLFYCEKPPNGLECVVGRPSTSGNPTYGMYTFYEYGVDPYWVSKYGDKVKVYKYDNWCSVEDVIDYAEDKFLEDFREAIDKAKLYL